RHIAVFFCLLPSTHHTPPSFPTRRSSDLRETGYTNAAYGLDAQSCAVLSALDRQSPDIAVGVDIGGAGDQGMMFGYATDETPELMPAPILLAHRITRRLAEVRKDGTLPWLRPDGKAQVTVEYEGDRPVRVHTVVVSAQHEPDITLDEVREAIVRDVIAPALDGEREDYPGREGREWLNAEDREWFDPERCVLHINPTGRFVVGGPQGD